MGLSQDCAPMGLSQDCAPMGLSQDCARASYLRRQSDVIQTSVEAGMGGGAMGAHVRLYTSAAIAIGIAADWNH